MVEAPQRLIPWPAGVIEPDNASAPLDGANVREPKLELLLEFAFHVADRTGRCHQAQLIVIAASSRQSNGIGMRTGRRMNRQGPDFEPQTNTTRSRNVTSVRGKAVGEIDQCIQFHTFTQPKRFAHTCAWPHKSIPCSRVRCRMRIP